MGLRGHSLRRPCLRRRRFRPAELDFAPAPPAGRVSHSAQHLAPCRGPSSRSCSTPPRRPPTAVQ
eukprot:6909711-Prymnesium_polylepis.1